jgi:broad specificity phosphatase PhoE
MQIVLLRHGKPDFRKHGNLSASEFHEWVESYNLAGLMALNKPSKKTIEIANGCNIVVCSDLPRSIESAHALEVNKIDLVESLFREIELPHGSFPSPKLPPNVWVVLFRILCVLGYSSNGESLRAAKLRASKGANKLKEIAENNSSVLFVGHGFVNRLIAKELLSSGWQGPTSPGKQFWEFGVYEYAT